VRGQSQNGEKLRSVVQARLAQFAKEMSLIEQGDRASATALVSEAGGTAPIAIRDVADKMRIEEDRLFALRTANADRSQQFASIVTPAGSGLVVPFAAL